MQRLLLSAVVIFGLVGSGCLWVPMKTTRSGRASALTARNESCPPGHRWSDGRCHSTGKGHDPAKHASKAKKKKA
jgi:hypothetical protein